MAQTISILADVLHEYLCQSEEPLAVAYRQRLAQQQGEPCMESLTNGAPDATCKVVVGKAEAHVAPTTAGQSVNATVLPTALEDWLPSHTVERKLGISTRTLQTLRDNGTMPYTKLGGKIYYKRSDIQRILDDAYTMSRLKNPDGYGSIRK